MNHDYDEVITKLPQQPPYAFVDLVQEFEVDWLSRVVMMVTGADRRLVTLASDRRVLPLGVLVEPLLQTLILGRTLARSGRFAYLLKGFKGECQRLPEAGERVDLTGRITRVRESWGISNVTAEGSYGPVAQLPRVAWFQVDLNQTDGVYRTPPLEPIEKDPLRLRKPLADFTEIHRRLGIREPWGVHLDAVTEWEPGQRLVAVRRVSAGLPEIQGHFPGLAIMPGSLQVESAWQAVCLLFERPLLEPHPDAPVELRVDWKFPSQPGETQTFTAEAVGDGQAEVRITTGRGTVARAIFQGLDRLLERAR